MSNPSGTDSGEIHGRPTPPSAQSAMNAPLPSAELIDAMLASLDVGPEIRVTFRQDDARFAAMLPGVSGENIEATADAAAEWVRAAIMLAAATKGVRP